MIAFVYYPLFLISFWYKDVVGGLIDFFVGFNRYLASLLSIPLLLRTFYKPLKNEYREGLVLFSVVAGMIIKFVLLSVGISIILIALIVEFLVCLIMLIIPLALPLIVLRSNNFL